jgi:hypothetical protein
VDVRRHPGARRYTLRLAAEGRLRLTVPRGASIAEGLRFVAGQAEWIQRERLRQAIRHAPWRQGTTIWYRGERTVLTIADGTARFGTPSVTVAIGSTDVRDAVEAHLRREAAGELPGRCLELADRCRLAVTGVRVRNQRSRWGACSPRGLITLNWRLVQMPPDVSDYVIVHELMHLRQPNHSRRFWREVDKACRWWRDAERWLRRHGRELLP